MSETKYGKYIITDPDIVTIPYGVDEGERSGYLSPPWTYLSNKKIENFTNFGGLIWIYEIPSPNPFVVKHKHPADEIMFFIGNDPENPEDLGGEVDIMMGDEVHTINKTAAVFVPKDLPHAPIWYRRVDRPHMFIGFLIGSGEYC